MWLCSERELCGVWAATHSLCPSPPLRVADWPVSPGARPCGLRSRDGERGGSWAIIRLLCQVRGNVQASPCKLGQRALTSCAGVAWKCHRAGRAGLMWAVALGQRRYKPPRVQCGAPGIVPGCDSLWELGHKEGWCFQTVVLEKTLENPLDSKEIKPVNPKGN